MDRPRCGVTCANSILLQIRPLHLCKRLGNICLFGGPSLIGSLDDIVVLRYISNVKEIAYSRTALKALTRMPRNWAERIRDKIRIYANDPAALANNVKRLKGQDGLVRLRVGDWRVVMRDESVLQVLYVTSRGST